MDGLFIAGKRHVRHLDLVVGGRYGLIRDAASALQVVLECIVGVAGRQSHIPRNTIRLGHGEFNHLTVGDIAAPKAANRQLGFFVNGHPHGGVALVLDEVVHRDGGTVVEAHPKVPALYRHACVDVDVASVKEDRIPGVFAGLCRRAGRIGSAGITPIAGAIPRIGTDKRPCVVLGLAGHGVDGREGQGVDVLARGDLLSVGASHGAEITVRIRKSDTRLGKRDAGNAGIGDQHDRIANGDGGESFVKCRIGGVADLRHADEEEVGKLLRERDVVHCTFALEREGGKS